MESSPERPHLDGALRSVAGDGAFACQTVIGSAWIGALVRPAHGSDAGGDWCDAFALPSGAIALSIGDVTGHGSSAHALMLPLRGVIRAAARAGAMPEDVLDVAHRTVVAYDGFASAIFGLFDPPTRTFAFANAGHPPPLLVSDGASHYVRFERADVLLGVGDTADRQTRTIVVPLRTQLVLYTDGVSERTRDPIAGETDLARVAMGVFGTSGTVDAIATRLDLDGSNADDVAILTLSQLEGGRPWTTRASRRRHRLGAVTSPE